MADAERHLLLLTNPDWDVRASFAAQFWINGRDAMGCDNRISVAVASGDLNVATHIVQVVGGSRGIAYVIRLAGGRSDRRRSSSAWAAPSVASTPAGRTARLLSPDLTPVGGCRLSSRALDCVAELRRGPAAFPASR